VEVRKLVCLFFLLVSIQGVALADDSAKHPLALRQSSDLREVQALDREVDQLLTKIQQCAVAELAPAGQCHCQYPSKLASVKNSINRLLEKHPDWDDRALLWWDRQTTYASSLHLGGVQRQLDEPCNAVVTTIRGVRAPYPGEE
jgi:hypothetical protein